MNELPEIINKFAVDQRSVRNHSPRTIEQYEIDLLLYTRFLMARRAGLDPAGEEAATLELSPADVGLYDVSKEVVLEFLAYTADDRNNKARTRARKLSSLKAFYKFLTQGVGLLSENPAKDVEGPNKLNRELPKFLSLEESLELLRAVRDDTETKTRERDYAIITLFLNTGMRLSELAGIDLRNVDRELRSVRIVGKGSKERIVYLNEACVSALKAYLEVRGRNGEIKDKNALFISGQHRRISIKTIQWMVYKYLDMAGLGNKKCSVHKLRHTAATLMYQTGKVDVRVLKDILGHEQLNTTQIYTHVSDAQMENAVRANPLSKLEAPEPDGGKDEKEEAPEVNKDE